MHDLPSYGFEDLLARKVVETLEEVLGEKVSRAIVSMMAELNQSSIEDTLRDPKAVHFGLLGLFGSGGLLLERIILQKLEDCVKVKINADANFLEEIEKIRSAYSKPGP